MRKVVEKQLRRIRQLLHQRYLRACVLALSLAAAAGAFATIAIEVRYSVPARAVVRYFVRVHSSVDDLKPLLRQPETLAALQELQASGSGMNAGGLVYSVNDRLQFHPWRPDGAATAAELRSDEREAVYGRLLPKYLAAELDGLIAELSHPETRRGLGRLGVSPQVVEQLRLQSRADLGPRERNLLLRRAARLIRPFMPNGADRYHLELADKLRFYAAEAPRGRYLGIYEVRGQAWLSRYGPDPVPVSGRRLVITKEAGGSMVVDDLRPSGRRVYRLIPVGHPAGPPLYRIGRRA